MRTYIVESIRGYDETVNRISKESSSYELFFLFEGNDRHQVEKELNKIFNHGNYANCNKIRYTEGKDEYYHIACSYRFHVYTINEFNIWVSKCYNDKRVFKTVEDFIENGIPLDYSVSDNVTLLLMKTNDVKIINMDAFEFTGDNQYDIYDYRKLHSEPIEESRRISPRGRRLMANRRLPKRPNRLVESFEISPSGMDSLLAGLNSYNVDDHIPFNEDSELSESAREIKKIANKVKALLTEFGWEEDTKSIFKDIVYKKEFEFEINPSDKKAISKIVDNMETTYPFIICEVKFDGNICKLLFVTNTYHNTYDKKAGYKKMFKDIKPLETNLSFFVKTLLTFGTYAVVAPAVDFTDQVLIIDHWKKNLPKLEKDLQFCEDFARKLEYTYGIYKPTK